MAFLTIQVLGREARARAGIHGHESPAYRKDQAARRDPRVDARCRACVPSMSPRAYARFARRTRHSSGGALRTECHLWGAKLGARSENQRFRGRTDFGTRTGERRETASAIGHGRNRRRTPRAVVAQVDADAATKPATGNTFIRMVVAGSGKNPAKRGAGMRVNDASCLNNLVVGSQFVGNREGGISEPFPGLVQVFGTIVR
jgi:hypothetical protein